MRKAKLYQLLAVAGGLSVAVASTPAWAKGKPDTSGSSGDSSLTAVPLNWTAGTATVDGDISEWDLDDASSMNKMCTGGKIDGERNCGVKSSVQLSTMYARYDCDTETMYVLVLEAGNYEAEKSANDSWVTSDGQSEKILKADGSVAGTQFAWVTVGGDFQGYEASFQLPANGTYDNVEVHLQVSGNTSSTGKFDNYTSSIVGLTNCEMPVVEDPVDEPTDPVDEPTDPVDEPTDPVDEPTDPVDEPTDPVDEPTDPVDEPTDPVDEPTDPVDEPTDPVACSEITGSNGVPMSVIAEYESDGNGGYSFVEDSGTDIINIANDGTPSVEGGTVKITTFIEDGVQDSDGVVSGDSVQFCQVPVFDASEQVCLWSANKDADGNYINITQEGCTDAEQGKFYAIEAGGEFSSALEAE